MRDLKIFSATADRGEVIGGSMFAPAPPYLSQEDVFRANHEWGCNCGPASIAAMTGLTLDQVRPHLGDFEARRYTNPTLMWASLSNLGIGFSHRSGNLGRVWWPTYGLARIQWEGPWTRSGVPARAAYRHTHWVGVNATSPSDIGIFDVNAIGNGTGWVSLADWIGVVVPLILRVGVPRASGDWHITHSVEIGAGSPMPGRLDRPLLPRRSHRHAYGRRR